VQSKTRTTKANRLVDNESLSKRIEHCHIEEPLLAEDATPEPKDVRQALVGLEWARSYQLIGENQEPYCHSTTQEKMWLLGSAFRTLSSWGINGPGRQTMTLLMSYQVFEDGWAKRMFTGDAPQPLAELPMWYPTISTRDSYLRNLEQHVIQEIRGTAIFRNKKMVDAAIKSASDQAGDYCDRVERYYVRKGWKKATKKPELLKHIERSIRFQVGRESYSDISRREGVAITTVIRGIEKAFGIVGLTVRSDATPGFPKGKKHSRRGSAQILKQLGR